MGCNLANHEESARIEIKLCRSIRLQDFQGDEFIVEANLTCLARNDMDYLFVPHSQEMSKKRIMLASAIYSGKKLQSNIIPIRIIRASRNANTILQKGLVLGILEKCAQEPTNTLMMLDNKTSDNYENIINSLIDRHKSLLSHEELSSLEFILHKYREVFSLSSTDLGCISSDEHRIQTDDHYPIASTPRRIPMHIESDVENLIVDLEEKGIIQKSTSPWNSPIVAIRKKDGSVRLCIDYRRLNSITKRPIYPMPSMRELFDTLAGAKYFSSLDLSMGYYQVKMNADDMSKTAFTSKSGQYIFRRMPMGLCGATATFQRVMTDILRDFNWSACVIYLDDVLVFGKDLADHNRKLEKILNVLKNSNIKLSQKKCQFLRQEVTYLGHTISSKGIGTDEAKIEKISNWPPPSNNKSLHTFLGFCGYYRNFIKDYAQLVKPLETLLSNTRDRKSIFEWGEVHQSTFERLKVLLSSSPVLAYPNSNDQFILDTDASHDAMGAVLSQVQNGIERPISFASHGFSNSECNYCVTRKEMLAVYKYVEYFKHYLLGKSFLLRTDHKALVWMLSCKTPKTSQYCKWTAVLQNYDFQIEHRSGIKHLNADALSRQCEQCNMTHEHPKIKSNVKYMNAVEMQKYDPAEIVKEILSNNQSFEEAEYSKEARKETKVLLKMKEQLRIINDKLYLFADTRLREIPKVQCRGKIIYQLHKEMCHLGINKCYNRLKDIYFWPGMLETVTSVINGCKFCQKFKPNHTKKQNFGSIPSSTIFDVVSVDISEIPLESKYGFKYILGMIDNYSRYAMIIPLKISSTKSVIKAIEDKWIGYFGYPNCFHSDNGSQFRSSEFREFCERKTIKQTFSPPYSPSSNGQIERLFKTVKPLLYILCEERNNDWSENISDVQTALRNSICASTKASPNSMVFHPKIRDNIIGKKDFKALNESKGEVPKSQPYIGCRGKRKFNIGDIVYVRNDHVQNKKTKWFDGPYKIIDQIGSHNFRVKKSDKTLIRSGRQLKKGKDGDYVNTDETCGHSSSESVNTSIWRRNKSESSHPQPLTRTASGRTNEIQASQNNVRRYPRRKLNPIQKYGFP